MNLFVFTLLVIQSIRTYGYSLYAPEDCADFTVGDCTITPDSIINQFPTDDVPMCQEVCRHLSSCMLFSHDGLTCLLLSQEYRKACGDVGAPVDADMDHCQDAIVESCSGFDEENCEYLGESVGVDPPDGEVSDPLVCQDMCETFGFMGCTFWVYKDKAKSCQLLKSGERKCTGISGPRAPPIDDCGFLASTTTQQTTTTTTQNQNYCPEFSRSVKGKWCEYNKQNVLKAFVPPSSSISDAIKSRDECEEFCCKESACWGCSIHCGSPCQFNAIPECGPLNTWTGVIEGDVTQKPAECEAQLTVKTANAIDNNAIGGVLVTLIQHDAIISHVTTDSAGQGHITSPHGQMILTAQMEGFTMAPVTFTVGEEECEKTIKLSLSPETSDPARVVMNWVDLPNDLDLHVKQLKDGSEVCHCFYSHKECDGYVLDVDNTNGGENGAESITWAHSDESSQYLIFVYDFSGDATHLSESGARVSLYNEGQDPTTVNVPANGSSNRYWKVGCFNSNGFMLINQLVANEPSNC